MREIPKIPKFLLVSSLTNYEIALRLKRMALNIVNKNLDIEEAIHVRASTEIMRLKNGWYVHCYDLIDKQEIIETAVVNAIQGFTDLYEKNNGRLIIEPGLPKIKPTITFYKVN